MTYYHNQKFVERQAAAEREKEALEAEEYLQNFPGWTEKLDDCPSKEEDIKESPNFESSNYIESVIDSIYHPGADAVYRSTEGTEIHSSINPNLEPLNAGQQCAYENGKLITEGQAAGTPDAFNPNATEWFSYDHYNTDVVPAQEFDLDRYHQGWPPNQGDGSLENRDDSINHLEEESSEATKLEAEIDEANDIFIDEQESEILSNLYSDRDSFSFESTAEESEFIEPLLDERIGTPEWGNGINFENETTEVDSALQLSAEFESSTSFENTTSIETSSFSEADFSGEF